MEQRVDTLFVYQQASILWRIPSVFPTHKCTLDDVGLTSKKGRKVAKKDLVKRDKGHEKNVSFRGVCVDIVPTGFGKTSRGFQEPHPRQGLYAYRTTTRDATLVCAPFLNDKKVPKRISQRKTTAETERKGREGRTGVSTLGGSPQARAPKHIYPLSTWTNIQPSSTPFLNIITIVGRLSRQSHETMLAERTSPAHTMYTGGAYIQPY